MPCHGIPTEVYPLVTFSEPDCEGRQQFWKPSAFIQTIQAPFRSLVISADSDLTLFKKPDDLELKFDRRIWGNRVVNTLETVDLWGSSVPQDEIHTSIGDATHLRLINHKDTTSMFQAKTCLERGDTPECRRFLEEFCSASDKSSEACDLCQQITRSTKVVQQLDQGWIMEHFSILNILIVITVCLLFAVVVQTVRLRHQRSKNKT